MTLARRGETSGIDVDGGAARHREPTRGRPTDLPVVGPRHGKIASAVHRDRERVGELAHEGAVGGEVSPRQVAQAPVRPFHQLATVERAQGVTDEEVVGGEAERAQGVVGDEVVRRPGLRMYRFM